MQTAVLILFSIGALAAADPALLMSAHTFTASDGQVLPYRRWQAETAADTRLPLVVFLHGAGGRGDDNHTHLRDGLPHLLEALRVRHPCILVAPQCPPDAKWTGIIWQERPLMPRTTTPTRPAAAVLELITALGDGLPIDPDRILLTGVSMGGSGTWDLATRAPGRFAALMPLCGGCDARDAVLYDHTPLWAFQGSHDEVVLPELPRAMMAALTARGRTPRYREFPDAGHDIARRVYGDAEAVAWLLAQRRAAAPRTGGRWPDTIGP
jgi:predicted peptidase